MMLDGHIHIREGSRDRAGFLQRLNAAGVDGGVLLSLSPGSFVDGTRRASPEERMVDLFFWCAADPNLHPFF